MRQKTGHDGAIFSTGIYADSTNDKDIHDGVCVDNIGSGLYCFLFHMTVSYSN